MFSPNSLGLVLAVCVYAAAARQLLSDLYDNCEFTVDHTQYDLCPLFHSGVAKVRAELAPAVQSSYEISFGGSLGSHSGESGAEPQVSTADTRTFNGGKLADSCFSALQAHGFV